MIHTHVRRRTGFTLIEVLVVVAIIALLIAILLPSLNRARAQARYAACLSNLRQFGIGVQGYAVTSKETIPAGGNQFEINWPQIVAKLFGQKKNYKYVNDIPIQSMEVFHCPERTTLNSQKFIDYSVNALDPLGPMNPPPSITPSTYNGEWQEQKYWRLGQLSRPSDMVYICDTAPETENTTLKEYRANYYADPPVCPKESNPSGLLSGLDGYDIWRGEHMPDNKDANEKARRRAARQMHAKSFTAAVFMDTHGEGMRPPSDALTQVKRYEYWLRKFGIKDPVLIANR